jgi:hypothetical protein
LGLIGLALGVGVLERYIINDLRFTRSWVRMLTSSSSFSYAITPSGMTSFQDGEGKQ